MSTFDILENSDIITPMKSPELDNGADIMREIKERQIHSLPSLILRQLRSIIFTGQIRPGQKIKEAVIAKQLSVSRGSVREACRQLVEAGVLENFVQRGNFVRKFSTEEAQEIYEVRAELFELAGRLAAQRATPEHILELTKIADEMDVANKQEDLVAIFPLNLKFHDVVLDIAANSKLKNMYLDIYFQCRLFRLQSLDQTKQFKDSAIAYHGEGNKGRRAIIKALESNKPDHAAEVFKQSVLNSRDRSLRIHQKQKETNDAAAGLVA